MDFQYVFGPVPSRRLGLSLGVSPIPSRTCNHTCIYCQLGRTRHMTNTRKMFFPVRDIVDEVKIYLQQKIEFDVVSIVGEGEPTLYAGLGELVEKIRELTPKPVAVITNGALLADPQVRRELCSADIVLPSFDAPDADTYRKINRPHGRIDYGEVCRGLEEFSHEYTGQLWLEIMLVDGVNCDDESLLAFREQIRRIRHDRLYINAPVRPPAEAFAQPPSAAVMKKAVEMLDGISIDMLAAGNFQSEVADSHEALAAICRRHPMNQFEIAGFLESRHEKFTPEFAAALAADPRFTVVDCKGIKTYRAD